ncbi:NUMOD4 motif-containing HNH endonuclease [Escherichia coli]|uniref:NUMOD4 motif-containing HNH endonuclease n=1 Tax=Escherichia coli TaxID=562 RepID=UPI00201B65B3|nr:NUMOD4 motif-containing HNH endonuclease [Escherichia coli]
MIEVWVDIEGIPFYQVSNKGNFRSITREITVTSTRQRPYKKIINGTSVKPFKCKSTGYLQIKVYGKKYSAHRIVAKAFCTGFCDGLVVNHKNGQRDDNRAENLEWVSHSENSKHGYKQNGRIPISLGKFSGDHPASKAVISTDMKLGRRFIMKQLWMLSEKDLIVRQLVVAVMAKAHITKEDSGDLQMKQ